jgi:hypothetical protein
MSPGNVTSNEWKLWSFNPYNMYACWLYAKEFGGAPDILNNLKDKLRGPPNIEAVREKPHALNAFAAGYIGWLALQKLAGQAPDPQVEKWLQQVLDMRVELLDADPREVNVTEAGGFLLLVPEFGDLLGRHAREGVARQVDGYNDLAPMWFIAHADEPSRVTRTTLAEGCTAHFYDYSSLFNAKAFALKQSGKALEKYLDVPAVARGDLYYIQNLISTIEAGSSAPGAQRPSY